MPATKKASNWWKPSIDRTHDTETIRKKSLSDFSKAEITETLWRVWNESHKKCYGNFFNDRPKPSNVRNIMRIAPIWTIFDKSIVSTQAIIHEIFAHPRRQKPYQIWQKRNFWSEFFAGKFCLEKSGAVWSGPIIVIFFKGDRKIFHTAKRYFYSAATNILCLEKDFVWPRKKFYTVHKIFFGREKYIIPFKTKFIKSTSC